MELGDGSFPVDIMVAAIYQPEVEHLPVSYYPIHRGITVQQ